MVPNASFFLSFLLCAIVVKLFKCRNSYGNYACLFCILNTIFRARSELAVAETERVRGVSPQAVVYRG